MIPQPGRVVGLTGYYCSGKSTIQKILNKEWGYHIIDVDKVGHQALQANKKRLVVLFGNTILGENGIDRKALGSIVFSRKQDLKLLNSIVHPWMVKTIGKEIDLVTDKPVCIDAALLFSMKLYQVCDSILLVRAPFCTLVQRGKKRDNRSFFQILNIIRSQKRQQFTNINRFDVDIQNISNSGSIEDLNKKVALLMQ